MDKKQQSIEYRRQKQALKDELRQIKRDYAARRRRLAMEHALTAESGHVSGDPPRRGTLEEVGNAVTHGVGAIFAIVSLVLMLGRAEGAREVASACMYSVGMFITFLMSCLYHSLPQGRAVKRLFRRFDHLSIYLLIGATFAPPLLCYVGDPLGITFFIVQWAVIAVGITMMAVFGPGRLKWLHMPLYLILGWSALMLLPEMLARDVALALWILAGGVLYSLGVIPFILRRGPSHFIWHFFVLAGALTQWIGIFLYIYR